MLTYAVCYARLVLLHRRLPMYLLFVIPSISLVVMAVMEMASELRGGKSNI